MKNLKLNTSRGICMRFDFIKTMAWAMAFAFTGMGAVAAPASADSLDTDRSVFNSGTIRPTVRFDTEYSGDMYVAIVANGTLFFKTPGGLTTSPQPFLSSQIFSGSVTLFQADSQRVSPGIYRLYEVETDAGADVFDRSRWHGGTAGLKVRNFIIKQPTAISNDYNGDGWPDDDANHDGFHDDDRNRDGYHDDDNNRDGYHDDDRNHDGNHDEARRSCERENDGGEGGDDGGEGGDDGCGEGGGDGSHNAGRDCTSCHNFSVSGTVYANAAGSSPVQGATVMATSATGAVAMTTDRLGNFYTTRAFSGPYSITVQKSSRVAVMQNQRVYGGCNTTGCHAGNSAQGRVFLP